MIIILCSYTSPIILPMDGLDLVEKLIEFIKLEVQSKSEYHNTIFRYISDYIEAY